MANQLIVHKNTRNEQNIKRQIVKRKKLLLQWTEKYEQLKLLIDNIQEEYTYRIGRLFAKDNSLDIEIIRHKKIKELTDLGISYEEAEKEIKERYKNEKEEENIFGFEMPFEEDQIDEISSKNDRVRKLWKKLLQKFHPDLTTDSKEKEKRTEIMKAINHAYRTNDLLTLEQIEEKETLNQIEQNTKLTIQELEQALVNIENAIIRTKLQLKDLKVSEWFSWTKMTKQAKNKLLQEMEERILDDIKAKEELLKSFQRS